MRKMAASDIEKVLAIEQAVQAYPWTRGNFCDAMECGYLCYVEENDGKLCSYAVLMVGVDEAELLNIAVAAEYQRKGLGGRMLRTILQIAHDQGFTRVLLEVRASNLAAISLYRLAGFAKIGVRRDYYHNASGSEDAIVMACDVETGKAMESKHG